MEAFRKIYPQEFYKKFLVQNVRPDGRPLDAARKTTISVGSITSAHGSSFVKMGNTAILCGVKGEIGPYDPITTPTPLVVNLEMPSLCGSKFRQGRPTEEYQAVAQTLNDLAQSLISGKQLIVTNTPEEVGKVSWYLYADVYCLDYDGSVFDGAVLALLAALHNVRLPELDWTDSGHPIARPNTTALRLNVLHHPISLTFGILEDYLLADPTAEEESLLNGSLTIVLDEYDTLCALHKPGGASVDDKRLEKCMQLARKRVQKMLALLNKTCS